MPLGKYSRVDNRRPSSNYFSTVTVAVLVALCLGGVWMITTSSISPVQKVDLSQKKKDQIKELVTDNKESSNNPQFEDNPGDLPEDATKGDSVSSNQEEKPSQRAGKTSIDEETKPEDGSTSGAGDSGHGAGEWKTYPDVTGFRPDDTEENENKPKPKENEKNDNTDESKTKSVKETSETKTVDKSNGQTVENVDQDNKNEAANEDDGKKAENVDLANKETKKADDMDGERVENVDTANRETKVENTDRIEEDDVKLGKKETKTNDPVDRQTTEKIDLDNNEKRTVDKVDGQPLEKVDLDDNERKTVDKVDGQPLEKVYLVSNDRKTVDKVDGQPSEKVDLTGNDRKTDDKVNGQPLEKIDLDNNGTKTVAKVDGQPLEEIDPANKETKIVKVDGETLDKVDIDNKETKTNDIVDAQTMKKVDPDNSETKTAEKVDSHPSEKVDLADKELQTSISTKDGVAQAKDQSSHEVDPSGSQSQILQETTNQNGPWSTQKVESENENEAQISHQIQTQWTLCNATAGPDYIPCLDNWQAIRRLPSTQHYEHRERHCPEEPPICLVPLPERYRRPIQWPKSREKIWYYNVPHTKLAKVKGHQNWVKVDGEYLTFPGGGTQFVRGALHYIDFIQKSVPGIAWGKRSRVVLDVGCGVASFGGFLFDRGVLTMSFAPKDEHEAQVQFALERGIPAISAVMGTKRLPFPARAFDVVHCARCRVPWHIEGGKLLLELNRLLRPGGFFIWSATPVYRKDSENVRIWEAMNKLLSDMCWKIVSVVKDTLNEVGIAIYKKPTSNECYEKRPQNEPPICLDSDDPNAAWNVPLQACIHKIPVNPKERGSKWPKQWPARVGNPPYWLLNSRSGVYGKPARDDFVTDYRKWKDVVHKSYLNGIGINWSSVRNVMDMRAVYGGFAAALKDMDIWVMNVVPVNSADTLPIIYERGLFGIYHDWCESFSTYPRTYDLLHADHLFSNVKKRCNLVAVIVEVDRILRPEGKLIVRDNVKIVKELESIVMSMQWEVQLTYNKGMEGLLCVQKSMWRPKESSNLSYAVA